MKNLENLREFQIENQDELSVIQGGLAAASNKKDVTSDSNDSFKKDKQN